MIESANVLISKCLYRQIQERSALQMSGSANVQVESANGRLAEISKCLGQQMSKPSQLKSRQQKSVSKSPVGKCQIGKIPHTTYNGPAQESRQRNGIERGAGLCGRAEFTEDSCTEATPFFCLTPGQYSAVYPIPIPLLSCRNPLLIYARSPAQ